MGSTEDHLKVSDGPRSSSIGSSTILRPGGGIFDKHTGGVSSPAVVARPVQGRPMSYAYPDSAPANLGPLSLHQLAKAAPNGTRYGALHPTDDYTSAYDNLRPPSTVVYTQNPISAVYRIDSPLTLQTDHRPYMVAMVALRLEEQLQFVCVPREGASVFIEATIKNTSKYDLLTGPISVFMDGGFVTKTQLRVSTTPTLYIIP